MRTEMKLESGAVIVGIKTDNRFKFRIAGGVPESCWPVEVKRVEINGEHFRVTNIIHRNIEKGTEEFVFELRP
jgi:hypothetical protein